MNVPEYIHGNIAPVITAFKDDESFDEVGQRNLFDYMLEVGSVSAFFCRSGMGQMIDYLYEDVQAMAKCACEHLVGKMPIIMNCSGIWDRRRLEQARSRRSIPGKPSNSASTPNNSAPIPWPT